MENYGDLLENLLAYSVGIIVFALIFALAFVIFVIVCDWKLFKKCGVEGWKSIIPFYSTYTLLVDIAGLNWWWFLISLGCTLAGSNSTFGSLLTLGGLFVSFVGYYNISKKFNKTPAFAVGCTLLPFIFIPILALGKENKFNKDVAVSANGPF